MRVKGVGLGGSPPRVGPHPAGGPGFPVVKVDPDTHRVHPAHCVVHRMGGFLFSLLRRTSTSWIAILPGTPPEQLS